MWGASAALSDAAAPATLSGGCAPEYPDAEAAAGEARLLIRFDAFVHAYSHAAARLAAEA